MDYKKQGKCPRCTTCLCECGLHIARLASALYYLEVSTFWFVLDQSLIRLALGTLKHARFVDSETCPPCFHNQELHKMTNSHSSLTAEFLTTSYNQTNITLRIEVEKSIFGLKPAQLKKKNTVNRLL